MASFVLDAFALVAYLQGEPGRDRVRELLRANLNGEHDVHMTVVNLGEALYIVQRSRGLYEPGKTLIRLGRLKIAFTT
jgi:ribonuclease VapC